MRRRLTLHVPGATFAVSFDHEDAEALLGKWRAVQAGDDDAERTAQLDCSPVIHIALGRVTAITDEPTGDPA